MNKNESIKICRICGVISANDGTIFEKHRKVCRDCRNKYHKNRREDMEDGKRDRASWYKAEDELTNERIIKKLEKLHKGKTGVKVIPEHTLRNTTHDSAQESRYIAYCFILVYAIIIYICVVSWADSVGVAP